MKIPTKITKRQFTALNKKNLKELEGELDAQRSDLGIEVDIHVAWDPDGLQGEADLLECKETLRAWYKDTKLAFRDYIKNKKCILKAYQRGLK